MWGMIISAAASLAQGANSAAAANKNAALAAQTGQVNYNSILATGENNASAIESTAMFNAALSIIGANINASAESAITAYNANLQREIGSYNAGLLMGESVLIWDAANLEIENIEYQMHQDAGNILASYGASGIQINSTDSIADVLIDSDTQHQMNISVVRHGADIEAGKLKDAAARSIYEGEMEARRMEYETSVRVQNSKLSAAFSAMGSLMQGSIDAGLTRKNAGVAANQALQGGSIQSAQYRAQAKSAMNSGLFSAAGSVASSYVGNATASSSFRAPTSGTAYSAGSPYSSSMRPSPTSHVSSQGTVYNASLL